MPTLNLETTITIALSVKDRKASVAWYEKHLGFKLLFHGDAIGWSEVSTFTAGVTLGFGDMTEPKPGNSVPVFGVADIESAYQALSEAGVRFDGGIITHEGMVKLVTFYDPDDNALMLAQNLVTG